MRRRFVDDLIGVNVKAFDLRSGINCVRVGDKDVCIAWEQYLFGKRPWFMCPHCGRKCKFLYEYESSWSCRQCQGLVYRSQWISKWYKFIQKEQRLLDEVRGGKPKSKHQNKFNRLLNELEAVQTILNAAMAARYSGMKQLLLRKATKQVIEEIKRR